ncbi:uncharacterized protein LOC142344192 [Convolutriloba macropyga]|uniref:uncharacterized protein LOC142344192 n=1 Tax=Convolutriloba macropyga TaxID=536237 RepID=UPI003F51CB11
MVPDVRSKRSGTDSTQPAVRTSVGGASSVPMPEDLSEDNPKNRDLSIVIEEPSEGNSTVNDTSAENEERPSQARTKRRVRRRTPSGSFIRRNRSRPPSSDEGGGDVENLGTENPTEGEESSVEIRPEAAADERPSENRTRRRVRRRTPSGSLVRRSRSPAGSSADEAREPEELGTRNTNLNPDSSVEIQTDSGADERPNAGRSRRRVRRRTPSGSFVRRSRVPPGSSADDRGTREGESSSVDRQSSSSKKRSLDLL